MAKTGATGLRRIVHAGRYSWLGMKAAYRHEAAFRQEFWLVAALAPLAVYLGETPAQVLSLIAALLFVLLVELLNSAIEAVVDRIGDERHALSGRAKDMGSAAVLLAIVIAGMTWLAVLW